MKIRLVLVTCPDIEIATKISKEIVSKKLAACSNIIPGLTSIYEWQGKLETSSEVLLLLKTQKSCVEELEKEIIKLHPYDTPEFIVLDTKYVNEKYLAWIKSNTCN